MADDAAPAGTPRPFLPSAADGHHPPRPVDMPPVDQLPTHWPLPVSTYSFFYVWASEVGECCGPGTESLQGALDDSRAQLLCLACDKIRTVPSHHAEVII